MQSLSGLLATAGVNMNGVFLRSATGISADGQFIVGTAATGPTQKFGTAYVARYVDGVGGVTTRDIVQASTDDLDAARRRVMTQQHGFAAPLLGDNDPIASTTEAGVFATAGSEAGGATGRHSFGSGFTVLAGVSLASEKYDAVAMHDTTTLALAVRYVHPLMQGTRVAGWVGGWRTLDGSYDFSRTYGNGSGTATGTGASSGSQDYIFGRVGLVFDPRPADQWVVSAEIGRQRFDTGGYSETMSSSNPFEAHVSAGNDMMTVAKGMLKWSHGWTEQIDTTLWIAGARSFGYTTDLSAVVPGVGALSPSVKDTGWTEYGARIGYKFSDQLSLNAVANGVAGPRDVGGRAHIGLELKVRF
jgi:hypothetical protein